MKRIQLFAVLFAFLALPMLALASDEHHEDHTVTLKGEILDMACYVGHGAKGKEHAGCAKMCAKGGQPMGILTEDGTVYLLYASHDDATAYNQTKEFAGTLVELTGNEAAKSGIKGIEVHGVKGL